MRENEGCERGRGEGVEERKRKAFVGVLRCIVLLDSPADVVSCEQWGNKGWDRDVFVPSDKSAGKNVLI